MGNKSGLIWGNNFQVGLKMVILMVFVIIKLVSSSESRFNDVVIIPKPKNNHIKSVEFNFNRSCFPHNFIFGASSSAYQYEGAAKEDGRGPSVWDTYTHKYSAKIMDHSNGDVAADSYHRYKEDIKMLKEMGLDAYRFSISWSRVLPKGKLSGGVNTEGIRYYNNLINELLMNGIKPFVTLLHADPPQALEDDYGGFLSRRVITDFQDYAELCFREFGDRVKHWMTLNEPLYYSILGYALGNGPPGRCSEWLHLNCTGGDSGTEPYIVSHHQILAHAAAANLYKQKYKASQNGRIGIVLATQWFVPFSTSKQDYDAAQRSLDFTIGWFMEPLMRGKYPHSMSTLVKDRLPNFTKEESILVKGSFDFLGLNYYSASYAAHSPSSNASKLSYLNDWHATLTSERYGIPIGPKAVLNGSNVYPRGIRDLLLHMKKKYKSREIYITENGICELNNASLPLKNALVDTRRIKFHYDHMSFLREAIRDGVDVRGYFVWSLLDNFEWSLGYTVRYGFNFVDFKNSLKRYPKSSALWLKSFLQK